MAGDTDGWSTGRRPNKGAGKQQAAQEQRDRFAPVTCTLKSGQLPESIRVGATTYFRVNAGKSLGSFANGTVNFIYYVSRSGTTAQQQINVTYKYPHLSVEFNSGSQAIVSAHWTPVERVSDDASNPHVEWRNGVFGFYRNNAMKSESWQSAIAAKNALRAALINGLGMGQIPDGEPN
jgi:hypothetical protein